MDTRTLCSALLDCGWLDADFLIRLMDAYHIEPHDLVDEFYWSYGSSARLEINALIYLAFDHVAQEFLTEVVNPRTSYFKNQKYSIFTNCMDSSLWFDDEELNRWYEAWRKF